MYVSFVAACTGCAPTAKNAVSVIAAAPKRRSDAEPKVIFAREGVKETDREVEYVDVWVCSFFLSL
jgi:hypothetical protein